MEQRIKQLLIDLAQLNIIGRKVEVSRYPELVNSIPDKILEITEVIKPIEFDTVSRRFEPYTKEYGVEPLLCTLGDQTICIGTQAHNSGNIYYLDFDFGCFKLTSTIDSFLKELI